MISSSDDEIYRDGDLIAEAAPSRRVKVYRKRINPFEKYDEKEFFAHYRFDKEAARYIVDVVREDLTPRTNRSAALSAEMIVLVAIRYLAKGAYQCDIGDIHNISQQSVSICVKKFVVALASKITNFICFQSDAESLRTQKGLFFRIAGFPQCVAVVDGTHIKIRNPGGEFGARHRCRKNFYSINVQVVCDANYKIVDIVTRWRGSAHDSRIWRESSIKQRLENLNLRGGVVLGDGGYACSKLLLTPFRMTARLTQAEQGYNEAHIKTRSHVEKLFGQLKNKFRACFNGLQMEYSTAKATIIALAILHNISRERSSDFLGNMNETSSGQQSDPEDKVEEAADRSTRTSGSSFRAEFIRKHFSHNT